MDKEKLEKTIKRFQTFEPPEGYFLAFSGGKDSCVVKALADMAGVKYDAHYTHTSVDPPEVIRFVREVYKDVQIDFPRYEDGERITMWNLIPRQGMPPTRRVRYCCAKLKETQGEGRFVVTGVRKAESSRRRKKREGLELNFCKTTHNELYDVDNADDKLVRLCSRMYRRVLNPIIDWTTDEVWEFIHEYNVPYCKLYDEGYTRIGCIGCPMGGKKNQQRDFERYPKYKNLYIKAFDRMLKQHECGWKTGEDVMKWWLGEEYESNDTGHRKKQREDRGSERQSDDVVQKTRVRGYRHCKKKGWWKTF